MHSKIVVINIIGNEACNVLKIVQSLEQQGYHKIVLATNSIDEGFNYLNQRYTSKQDIDFIVKQIEYIQIDRSMEWTIATHNSELKQKNVATLPANVANQYANLKFIHLINICLTCTRDKAVEYLVKKYGVKGIGSALHQQEFIEKELQRYIESGEFIHDVTDMPFEKVLELVENLVSIEMDSSKQKIV